MQNGAQSLLPGSRAIQVYPPEQVLEGPTLPPDVRDLPAPPARLFLHGAAPSGPRIAIVGTRAPTPEASAYAEQLGEGLARRGVAVLSGGAKGIDASAHRGALRAPGVTLVVAASSFDRPYPSSHRALYQEIVAAGGGYLSSYPAGTSARRHQFLERNALLVAMCHALVLVEAPLRSGARNAVSWARRLGRACFVVPSPPWNERGRGCVAELQLGARALGSPDELLRWLDEHVRPMSGNAPSERREVARRVAGADGKAGKRGAGKGGADGKAGKKGAGGERPTAFDAPLAEGEGATQAAVLRALENGPRYAEQLADDIASASLAEVEHAILILLLSGLIARGADGELTATRR